MSFQNKTQFPSPNTCPPYVLRGIWHMEIWDENGNLIPKNHKISYLVGRIGIKIRN